MNRCILILLAAALLFFSCSDDEIVFTVEQTSVISDIIPDIPGADAVLLSTKNTYNTNYFGENVKNQFGSASAVFLDNVNNEYFNAGKVSIYSAPLKMDIDSRYVLQPDNNSSSGITFAEQVVWSVQGNELFPEVNKIIKVGWPYVGKITHPLVINQNDHLTIVLDFLSDAEFTTFRVIDESGNEIASHVYTGNKLHHTFTASNLSEVDDGVLRIQVEVDKREEVNVDERSVHFVNREILYSQVLKEDQL